MITFSSGTTSIMKQAAVMKPAAVMKRMLWLAALACAIPAAQATELVARAYPVKDFSEVVVGGNALLEVTQEGTEYLRVEASPETMERVKVDLTGKRLTLSVKSKGGVFGWFGNSSGEQVRFILRVKQLNYVELSGAARGRFGDLQGDQFAFHASGAAGADLDAINMQDLRVQLSGASNLKINTVNSQQQHVDLSGASNMEIMQAGKVDILKADISGASNLRARRLKATSAVLGASGASHIEVAVTDTLKAEASGASSIDYYGNPKAETNSSGASHINARTAE